MPRYDARHERPTDRALLGKTPDTPILNSTHFPIDWCGATDANGVVLSPLLWCDTETGEVGRFDIRDGIWQTDPQTGRVVVLTERHPTPLRQATADELKQCDRFRRKSTEAKP